MQDARNHPENYPIEANARTFSREQMEFIANTQRDSEIVWYLESMGCSDVEVGKTVDFIYNGESICIDFNSFEGGNMNHILRDAQKYTCCGDLIAYNGDSDICPTCKEHC